MKTFVLSCLALCVSISGFAEPIPADDILAFVRTKLPNDALKLTGTLKVRTEKGFTKISLPVEMDLDWGAAIPTASYRISDQTLDITWENDTPSYAFSTPGTQPTSEILDTGINWADLSFSMLWWPNAQLIDEQTKINRDCYVVDVPVPGSSNTMRLWIEKKMGMLLEAQTLDAKQKEIRTMKIRSIKKMDGVWVAKDLEISNRSSGNKTTLQITDLQWKTPKPPTTAFDPAESISQLSIDLYQQLATANTGNLVLSPYSISTALAMVYGGARDETAEQMEDALYFGGQGPTHPAFSYLRKTLNGIQEKGHVQLSIANSLWPQINYTLLPDYLAMTKDFYGSTIESVDYQTDAEGARKKINTWVEQQTNERIKDLIPAGMLDRATRLVLANAIYFKGNWARQFKPEHTRPAPFHRTDGKIVDVPMMSQTADFRMAHTNDFQALELPYEGDDLSMLIVLPSKPDGLTALEKSLTLELLDGLQFNDMETMVQLPQFKLESTFTLGDTLAAMGMPLIFSNQADFSGMTGKTDLSISEVVHKAFIEVNEEGTEAAAATAVGMRVTSMPPMFEANHPFLFLIRENSTGALLFIGRVTDPR